MELADRAMKDNTEQRLKMPMCMDPSDEEEGEAEDMEVSSVKPKVKKYFRPFQYISILTVDVDSSFANVAQD